VDKLPDHIAISPITIACPKCKAAPGDICEVLLGGGMEIVHVERIALALAMDVAAKARIPSKPLE
jgi:hypothetical protein